MEPVISSFSDFQFHPLIADAILKAGFQTPTPIQAQAIPHVSAGRDVLGLAQTGTGKTAAYALPILQALGGNNRATRAPRALVLVPTRELAIQVTQAFRDFGAKARLTATDIIGGTSFGRQLGQLRNGVDVVVACPGRLFDHIEQRTIDLSAIEHLVLDEADQMFDMGFFPTVRKILKVLPKKRQNLFFSATMAEDVRKLAHEVLQQPVTVEVSRGEAATTIEHSIYEVSGAQKLQLLCELLPAIQCDSVLVFTRTKHRAKRLARDLEQNGFAATSLQGNLSQNQRERAMRGFRSGEFQILVATDIAARGIDISTISHVINFDFPDTVDAYVHRIGRTGRAAKNGDAITFVTREDFGLLHGVERRLKFKIKRQQLEGFELKTPPQTAAPERREFRGPRSGGHGASHGRNFRSGPRRFSNGDASRTRRRDSAGSSARTHAPRG